MHAVCIAQFWTFLSFLRNLTFVMRFNNTGIFQTKKD